MDYVKYLREMVGNQPIILPGASVVIFNEKNQVLLQLRKDNNLWGLPGGAMNLSESFEDTAKREVYEETGLTINDLKLLNIFSGASLHYIYPNGDEVYPI
ncbi:NUDIX hydrolase [Macrococcus brunensis]|uniref:NUDIX hydrolase n=1 Tax=Macrococcus brunensis TaxID=198483 RepID=UPI001EF01560|nr:NUDIX domain-containing protein [Macrococcus brunensis]ULG71985.1 NUDIX domain-containing protein [Macrococcus brunensis]